MSQTEIMLIDDDPMFPTMFRHMWSRKIKGTKFEIFKDAGDALDKLNLLGKEAKHPDIILLDLYTLGMDGKEFLKKYEGLVTGRPLSKIYTVTASPSSCDMDLQHDYPFVYGSFKKPITASNIEIIVKKINS